ncbi:MAG TPA: ABC transporter permease [Thermomicrobiales bacterium]|nr:ABC transporter permease [Thermomicrobiales bacterium]
MSSASTVTTPLAEGALATTRRRRPGLLQMFGRQNKFGVVAAGIFVILVLGAIFAPLIAPNDPTLMAPIQRLKAPSSAHLLGTDVFGRDVLSRIIYGLRISIGLGVVSVLVAAVIGTLFGLIAGYIGRWQEYLIMRLTDVLFSFPSILLAILIVSIWGAGLKSIVIAIALVQTPIFIRIVRGSVLAIKHAEYIQASVTAGASTTRILLRHLLPNVAAPILVQLTLSMSGAVVMEAALSFLGLGAVPPQPSLGSMLSENRASMELAPWTVLYPGLALAILVLSINIVGDGVRDLLDPRLRSATTNN